MSPLYYMPGQDMSAFKKPLDADRLLRCLGVKGELAGFPYAVYMIERVKEDPDQIRLITKRLYRETARKFGVSDKSIERDLRTVIHSCWRYPDHSLLEYIAGTALHRPPSNSSFIDMLAAFLR